MMDGRMNRREALALTTASAALALAPDPSHGAPRQRREAIEMLPGAQMVSIRAATNLACAVSPDGNRLALDFAGVIWTVPIGGGVATPLTGLLGDSGWPDWLPDGGGIVFQRYIAGNFQLFRLNLADSQEEQLTFGEFDSREPAVSPDGKSVAYVSDRSGRCRLHELNLETLVVSEWADTPGEAAQPSWNHDGKALVSIGDGRRILVSGRDGGVVEIAAVPASHGPLTRSLLAGPAFNGEEICAVEVRGAAARLRNRAGESLTQDEDVFPFRPRWLRDGTLIYTADGQIKRRKPGASAAITIPVSFNLALPGPHKRRPIRPARPEPVQDARGIGSPAISPDGQQIAFRALNRLWIMPVGGRPEAVVSDGYCVTDPAWSPDGRRLAYTSDRGGTFDIWVRDMQSGAERQLTRHDGAAQAPAWSPVGDRLAFIDQRGALYLCDAVTGETRRLIDPLFMPGKPSWGPGGHKIALAALVPSSARFREGSNRVLVVDVASGAASYHPAIAAGSIATRGDDGPVWSPDGRQMAFVIASRLWVCAVSADGVLAGEPRVITDEVTDAPSWTSDSRRILYLSAGRLRLVDVASGAASTIPLHLQWARPKQPQKLLIRAGRLWDGESRSLRGPTDISVIDGRIASISTAGQAPAGPDVQVLDGSALVAMPGLIDAHVHVQMQGGGFGDREGRLWLAMGVTGVRSLAGPAYHSVEYRESVASGSRVGPRTFTTGEAIDGSRVFYHMMRPLTGSGQMALEMARAHALGYDLMKCYVRLSVADQKAVIDWAHRHGIPATSHYLHPAILLGMDGIEHMGATSRLGYSRSVSLTGRAYDDVRTMLAASGASQVPTLFYASAMYGDYPELLGDERITTLFPPWELRRLREAVKGTSEETAAAQLAMLRNNVQHLKQLVDLGGLVVAGTDAPLDFQATSLHMNLRGMVRYGFDPVDALFTATRNAGWMLGEPLGGIVRNAHADIILVEGDPLARIEDAANVRHTIAGGVVHDRASLLGPFARTNDKPVHVTEHALPTSPYWWHRPGFVASCREVCGCSHA